MTGLATDHGFQTRRTVILSMIIGSCGIVILGIQPLLLGGLRLAGVIDAVELGWIATAEVLGMAAGIFIATPGLRSKYAQLLAIGACVLMAACNVVTPACTGPASLALARSLAGLAEGGMVAVSLMTITYSARPGQLNAIYLTAGATPQLALAYFLPVAVFPVFGINSTFYIMAAIGLASAALAAMVRDPFAPSKAEWHGKLQWTPFLALSLAASLITAAAVGASWSYVEPMGANYGLTSDQVGLAVTISLAFQIVGSLTVALIGFRLPYRVTLPLGVAVQALSLAYLLTSTGMVAFCAALAVFGFLWQACMPFAMDLVVDADPSRATAPLILPITLAGLSFGPLIASALVGVSVAGAFEFSLCGFAVAVAIYLSIFRKGGVPAGATP